MCLKMLSTIFKSFKGNFLQKYSLETQNPNVWQEFPSKNGKYYWIFLAMIFNKLFQKGKFVTIFLF